MKQKHTVEVSNLWRSARTDTLKPFSNAMETPRSPPDAFRWMHRYCHARTVMLRWHIGFGLVFGTFVQARRLNCSPIVVSSAGLGRTGCREDRPETDGHHRPYGLPGGLTVRNTGYMSSLALLIDAHL
jgi:hypothetical protein